MVKKYIKSVFGLALAGLIFYIIYVVFLSHILEIYQTPKAPKLQPAEFAPLVLDDVYQNKSIKILFVGDIMLDRTIRKVGEELGYSRIFACLKEPFSKYDSIIGNLEGPVTNFKSISRNATYMSPESFAFTFDPGAVETLKSIGLSVVSLANNHIYDFGKAGAAETISHLKEMKLAYFGDPQEGANRWVIESINGTQIAYIPYNEFGGSKQETLDDIKDVQEYSDLQIVFSHWGDEYVPPRADVKSLAREFVDAGADLIIGAHPHVIQEKELYNDVWIYYSLGNFIFDQYFEPEVMEGLVVEVEIQNKKIKNFQEFKVKSKREYGTCFEDYFEAKDML